MRKVFITVGERGGGRYGFGLAEVDVSSSVFNVYDVEVFAEFGDDYNEDYDEPNSFSESQIARLIKHLSPNEIVIPERLRDDDTLSRLLNGPATVVSLGEGLRGDPFTGEKIVKERYGKAFCWMNRAEYGAAGSAIAYLGEVAKNLPEPTFVKFK